MVLKGHCRFGIGLQDIDFGVVETQSQCRYSKAPKFENEVAQSVREISSIVLPYNGIGLLGVGRCWC